MPDLSYFTTEPSALTATCSGGAAPYLANELKSFGFAVSENIGRSTLAVKFEGTLADCMLLNLHLRTAHRILYTLDRFRARGPGDLYNAVYEIPWERYLIPDGYFSVDSRVDTNSINDTRFASLKVKDAIADRMRNAFGYRPDSGNERTGACIFLIWTNTSAVIYLDTSGESLSRRGYRISQSEAPVRESLAAACIMASEWNPETHFLNPMCGCGTIAIEAAMMAINMPPAMLRKNFAFMHLAGFDSALWTNIRRKAAAAIKPSLHNKIIASDIDSDCVEMTKRNAERAGVDKFLEYEICDFLGSSVPEAAAAGRGVALMNPPYGNRIGDPARLRDMYAAIGVFTEEHEAAFDTHVLTGNYELVRESGLTYDRGTNFSNGGIDCVLMRNPKIADEADARARSVRRRLKRG